jgi:sugar phosphate isomerase/epimerase
MADKMKLGISSQSYDRAISTGRIDLFGLFGVGKELRLDGMEIEDKHFASTEPAYLEEVKAKAGEADLQIIDVAFSNDYGQASQDAREKALEKFAKWIDISKALGLPFMRTFAGWPASADRSLWEQMIKYLKRSCALAKDAGVLVALENHNHGGFAKDATSTLNIFEQVGADNMKLCLDTGNYIDGIVSIEKTVHLVIHVHAKYKQLDTAGNETNIDYRTIFGLLRAVNYTEYISVEYEGTEEEFDVVPRAVERMRGYVNE